MNRLRTNPWLATLFLAALVFTLPLACGGGGGGSPTPPGLNVTWTPANASPGANTVSMGPGTVSGANFSVPIRVTGINDFFGAAFRVNYDSTSATFQGFSASGSFIEEAGVTILISAVDGSAGEVLVNATRQQGAGNTYVPGVDPVGDDLLITLNFLATQATGAANGLTFSNTEVQTCNDGNRTCSPLAGVNFSGGSMTAR